MSNVCPNCKGTSNLKIHWYKPDRKSDRIIYRCPKSKTQVDVYGQTRRKFLLLWNEAAKQLRETGQIDNKLLRQYRDAKAAFLLAEGALNEEFSKDTL